MIAIFSSVLLVLLLVSSGLYLTATVRDKRSLMTPALVMVVASVVGNFLSLGMTVFEEGFEAILTIEQGLSILAFFIGAGFVGVRSLWRLDSLGVVVAPLLMLLQAVSLVSVQAVEVSGPWRGALLTTHISLSLFGTAAFALAALTGVFYLVQDSNLRQKKFGPMFQRLPSVDVLDKAGLRLILIGFPVYTLAIALGTLWAWDNARTLQLQYVFAMVAWLIYAAILQARLTVGWRGRRAAVLTLVGLLGIGAVLSTYLVRSTLG